MLSIYETYCDLTIGKRMFSSYGSASANGCSLDGAVVVEIVYLMQYSFYIIIKSLTGNESSHYWWFITYLTERTTAVMFNSNLEMLK